MDRSTEKHDEDELRLLLDGYRGMAADVESEREAWEWCEALIADALSDLDADGPLNFR